MKKKSQLIQQKDVNREKVLQALRDWKINFTGLNPSIRDLCAVTGIRSTSQVKMALDELHNLGLVRLYRWKARGISLVEGA